MALFNVFTSVTATVVTSPYSGAWVATVESDTPQGACAAASAMSGIAESRLQASPVPGAAKENTINAIDNTPV